MTIADLYSALSVNGFDVHYGDAPVGTVCPYVVFTNIEHPNFGADNKTYVKTTDLRIRLVEAEYHDWQLIGRLEDLLDDLGLAYGSTDIQAPSESVCETYYDISFLGGNKDA